MTKTDFRPESSTRNQHYLSTARQETKTSFQQLNMTIIESDSKKKKTLKPIYIVSEHKQSHR
jgi:predicted ATPase